MEKCTEFVSSTETYPKCTACRLTNDLGFNLYITPFISHLVTNSEDLGIEKDKCSSEYYNYLLIDILVLT